MADQPVDPTLRDEIAQALWVADGYDLYADPGSRTAQELFPVYLDKADALLPLVESRLQKARAEAWDACAEHLWQERIPLKRANPYRAVSS